MSTPNSAEEQFAYVTLVTSDDFVIGAQLLSYSLHKQKCSHPLLCIVTSNLTQQSLRLLTASSYTLLLVNPLPCPFPSHNVAWTATGLTKLRVFSLHTLHYTRLLYIDADCLALTNLDHLFHTPLPTAASSVPFAAAPDLFPPDRFNAGVLLLTPGLPVWQTILGGLRDGVGSYDGGDTGYLNSLFPDWYAAEACCRLHFRYNALRVMEWWTRKAPGYWDEALGAVSILHYCSSPKVWEARKGGKLEQLWWALHDEWQQSEAAKPAVATLSPSPVIDLRQQPVLPAVPTCHLPLPSSMLSVSFDAALTKRSIRFGVWSPDDRHWLAMLRTRYERQAKLFNNAHRQSAEVDHSTPPAFTLAHPNSTAPSATMCPSAATTPLIPRHIHHIWLGSPVPAAFNHYMSSFREQHSTLR